MIDPIIRLRVLCDDSGIRHYQIASKAGLDPKQLSNVFCGKGSPPSIHYVAKILEAIGCKWADLDW